MSNIYKLYNQVKNYEWGSNFLIPQFLGIENSSETPFAELWMGTHHGAPSKIEQGGEFIELKEVSGEIPFLFKLLAIEKPLSIQAHPNLVQAKEGFKREEDAGIDINAPERNYKDDNHKPEIICALSHFTLMAGFRETAETNEYLKILVSILPSIKGLITPLINALEKGSLSDFFRALFSISKQDRELIFKNIFENESIITEKSSDVITPLLWQLMKKFAGFYPNDIAILSPLYLNVLNLEPGQAIYVPSGILHAYINGFGVELMTASDNVLRGGLTPKHVDQNELIKILNFVPFKPKVIDSNEESSFYYYTPCNEFLLVKINGNGENVHPIKGPAVCLVTEGELLVDDLLFKKGESFFIPRTEETLFLKGNCTLFAAVSGEWRI